jgi:hypothetical protein
VTSWKRSKWRTASWLNCDERDRTGSLRVRRRRAWHSKELGPSGVALHLTHFPLYCPGSRQLIDLLSNAGESALSWDKKQRGSKSGYFYHSIRVPDRLYPVKQYLGKGAAAQLMAAQIENNRRLRQQAKQLAEQQRAEHAAADRLADEVREWAEVMVAALESLNQRAANGDEEARSPDSRRNK